jgi:hypothetical protein
MKNRFVRLACTAFCFAGFVWLAASDAATGASSEQPPSSKDSVDKSPSVKSKSDLKAKTPDEHSRAKFFDRYGTDPLEPGDSVSTLPGSPLPPFPPGVPLPTYEQFVQRVTCASPLIVVGHAQRRGVLLNEKETYLFTDYDVTVERWLRPEHGAPSLRMSVSGGRVNIGGKPTVAGAKEPLEASRQYIFFLQHIPGSGSLTPLRPPVTEGIRWVQAFPDAQLLPELAGSSVRLETFADDIARLSNGCDPGKGR